MAHDFRDAMALPGPLWLQRPIIAVLAALGRARGYRSTYAKYET